MTNILKEQIPKQDLDKLEHEKRETGEELINPEIESSDAKAREAISLACDIINDDFVTEEEETLAKELKEKIISLGFDLKNNLKYLIRLGIISGILLMNPLNLLPREKNPMPDNARYKDSECLTGSEKDFQQDGYLENNFGISTRSFWDSDMKKVEEMRKLANEKKDRVLKMISSVKYFERLLNEYGSVERTEKEINYRKLMLEKSDFTLKQYIYLADNLDKSSGVFVHENLEPSSQQKRTNKYFDINTNQYFGIYITKPDALPEELVHSFSQYRIPEKTKSILEESFYYDDNIGSKSNTVLSNEFIKSYYGNINERYAKLECLKLEMERLNIKKYEEQFTLEHYEKLQKRQDDLDGDLKFFLQTIKGFGSEEGFKWLRKMFEEIA